MIPKSGNRFSDKIMLKTLDHGLEHDPEKCKPVFPTRSCSKHRIQAVIQPDWIMAWSMIPKSGNRISGQNMLKTVKFPVCGAAAIR
jgi:hypothetical protein